MNVCRHCGRPVVRGKYLAWTHANGQARSAPAHYASPIRPTSRAAADDKGSLPVLPRRQREASDASPTANPPRRGTQPVASGEVAPPG